MEQTAIVRAVDGDVARLEIIKDTACSDCSRCGGCNLERRTILTEARNDAGAKPGERVIVSSPSQRILWYAFAVFILPPAAGIFCYLIMVLLGFTGGAVGYVLPAAVFAAAFIAACVSCDRIAKKNPDTVIKILPPSVPDAAENGGEGRDFCDYDR